MVCNRFSVALVLALPLAACAGQRSPVRVQPVTGSLALVPGESRQIDAVVVNRTQRSLAVEEGSGLRLMLLCRRPVDPPDRWGMGTGTGIEGGVYGGNPHGADPADPHGCRSNPPPVIAIPAGGTLPVAALLEVPGGCSEGEAELEISFATADHGRRCPGIWYGETPTIRRPVQLRRRVAEPQAAPSASPGGHRVGRPGG